MNVGVILMIAKIDEFLSRLPFQIPTILIEGLARVIGLGARAFGSPMAYIYENRVRGILYSTVFHVTGLRIGRSVLLRGIEKIKIGSDVSLEHGVIISALGDSGRVSIGRRSHIDMNSVLYGHGGIKIGSCCAIASGVTIYSQTNQLDVDGIHNVIDQETKYAEVTIGDDVWIGARSVILPGITIGDHAVIGAGSVVTRLVSPWLVVAGVPIKVLRDRRPLLQ